MTGINNLAMEDFGIIGSYRKVIERLSSSFKGSLIVQSILPVTLPWVKAEEIIRQNKMIESLASEFKSEYLDIHGRFVDSNGIAVKEYLMDDGVHLSNKGYSVWSDAVEEFLSRKQA